MPTQEHQALVQRHADFVNTGDERIADELFAEDYVQPRAPATYRAGPSRSRLSPTSTPDSPTGACEPMRCTAMGST